MNVAIIGCGYVGTAVARLWQKQGLNVTATTTKPERVPELNKVVTRTILAKGDDPAALQAVLKNQQVLLLSVGAPNAQAYELTYLNTAKTLAGLLPHYPQLQQLIYTSSYALYGNQRGNWVDEMLPLAPASHNAKILAETEQVLLGSAHQHLQVCIFRLAGIYGPGRELAKIFRRIAGTTQPGDGNNSSNWVHLDDIVGAVDFARQMHLQGVYNLVNDRPLPRRELIEYVCDRNNLAPVTWDSSQPSRRTYNAKVSNQKLKQAGYRFVHPEIVL